MLLTAKKQGVTCDMLHGVFLTLEEPENIVKPESFADLLMRVFMPSACKKVRSIKNAEKASALVESVLIGYSDMPF